ncbi:MAG: GNAT family N-acetyltransferase, partial [Candidatus Limnocylindrales bacterium]
RRRCEDARAMSTETPNAAPPISTPRFTLESMSLVFMRALLAGDLPAAEAEIGATVPADLPTQLDAFLQFRIADLTADPTAQPWLGRAIMLTNETGRHVIGSVGFHAPPDEHGFVEIGYRVEADFRRQGVASEVVRAMFDWAAREHGVDRFRASTGPDNVASQAVLSKFGFRQVGSQLDDIDGLELVYEVDGWSVTR